MRTTNVKLNWWEVSDVKVGQIVPPGSPYQGAKIQRIAKNGWCRCVWPQTGWEFSARVHWLTPKQVIYSHV